MKVVLRQPVTGLGSAGEVKEVADGYARNFLIPKSLAVPATAAELKRASEHKTASLQRRTKGEREAEALASRLAESQVNFKAKVGEQYRLYGSVTSGDIAEELSRQLGQSIDKRKVELAEPIRHLGTYKVPVRVAHHLVPEVTVVVERE